MSKIIVSTKCSDCKHQVICKYTKDFSSVNVDNLEPLEREVGELPVVLTIRCTEFFVNVNTRNTGNPFEPFA